MIGKFAYLGKRKQHHLAQIGVFDKNRTVDTVSLDPSFDGIAVATMLSRIEISRSLSSLVQHHLIVERVMGECAFQGSFRDDIDLDVEGIREFSAKTRCI